ncbi:MAG: hypothetical protein H6557_26865 [Lewinellaceae bacterium]|nr:hypothetical protein [Phaeodactylibacter sp.]MCB9040263.1 hypothetical protein [Lewinellaceae bacterium]MCB9267911.1 hypothetical protein [Lewinellaceae bacterium]
MPWINPVELLRLENHDPEKISEEMIAQALRRLRGDDGKAPVVYRKRPLSEEQLSEAIRELDDPARVRYYHRLLKYPELNNLLAGDPFARIEEEALQDELVAGPAAQQLQPACDEYLKQALENDRASALAAFAEQMEKGGDAFQDVVFGGKGPEYLKERLATVEQLAEKLEQGAVEESRAALGQLSFLREQVSVDALNALPKRFADTRDAFAGILIRMVDSLKVEDPSLALGVARHARRLRAGKALMERLNQAYRSLERRVESEVPESVEPARQKWLPWAWAGALVVLVMAAGVLVNHFYDDAMAAVSGLAKPPDEQTGEDAINEEEELPSDEALSALGKKLAEQGSISREELERILRESGGNTQLAEANLLLQLPWRERGAAYPEELSGEATLGAAPLEVCFPPRPASNGQASSFTVIGDPVYDALVFFFNGRTYFQQAFIPAKGKLKIDKPLNKEQVVSTMIIFGQDWSPEAESPCGTPGYFTKNIFYGGFAAYATDPPTLTLNRDGFLQLMKRRLMPSRQLEEEKFFELLERYR